VTAPTPHPDAAFLALQQALAGRFSLEAELGRGAMGIVYLARDVLLERPVAIKLLAPTFGAQEEMRARFLREARIAAQCFHPHIVPIHEVAESGDLAWFVMGYVAGETLAERLRRRGTLPPEMVRRIGREIGWALAYAHDRGVVHRDVKPENILLEQGTDRALIADFGIAWHDPNIANGGTGAQASGEVAGTARYMAPEQMLGDAIDGRADLYALGVTLHLAVTGRFPIEGGSAMAILEQHLAGDPILSVRTHAPLLPASLADTIDRCLATRPDDRFANAQLLVAELARDGEAAVLPPEVRDIRQGALSTISLVSWTAAIAYSGVFLVLGEDVGLFGRQLMKNIVEGVVTFAGIATALRGAETLVNARRALRLGVVSPQVVDALAPEPASDSQQMPVARALLLAALAAALAAFQGRVDQLNLPYVLEFIGAIITVLVPPILVQRALTNGLPRGLKQWLRTRVLHPAARLVVGWFGGRDEDRRAEPAEGATEMLLDQNANALLDRLPADARTALRALPAATHALAREAMRLRERAVGISGVHRRLRAERAPAARLAALEAERAEVEGRLGVTIAALESIRLGLLQLDAAVGDTGNLTEHLEVVRELQRRVDAAQDVERLLDTSDR
jgi:eukaryotic-like serine/threonine-protein kinase